MESLIDGEYLLPNERLTPDNIAMLRRLSPVIDEIDSFMQKVKQSVDAYQRGTTQRIVLNPADLRTYIDKIRSITSRIAGGYDNDGATCLIPLAASVLPDVLMTMRENQMDLCRLVSLYEETNGEMLGPIDEQRNEEVTTI